MCLLTQFWIRAPNHEPTETHREGVQEDTQEEEDEEEDNEKDNEPLESPPHNKFEGLIGRGEPEEGRLWTSVGQKKGHKDEKGRF